MHIHLDALGGVAGDMFVAALLDAWPDLAGEVQANLRLAGLDADVHAEPVPHDDGVLTGHRFVVTKKGKTDGHAQAHDHPHDHGHGHGHHHHGHHPHADTHHGHHHHTHWRELRASLQASDLPEPVKQAAIGIFHELATAEAQVHGKELDAVAFHEVGNWDSITDIVAAATLIVGTGATGWSVGSLPLGRGWIETEHGRLPVPAPATTLLLRGFTFHDDGHPGERITPTGAAILRYLAPAPGIGASPRRLARSGIGFGTRRFQGMSNVLRVLALTDEDGRTEDRVGVIQFEIDDQSGEELAVALDRIRADANVIDVTQSLAIGKKGRMMAAIQVLTRPEAVAPVSALCFRQTTTLGLRSRIEARAILPRRAVTAEGGIRVKLAERPGGTTAKAEIDDAATADSQKQRAELRRAAEAQALQEKVKD